MKTIHVRVEGRVQGVWFRDYTQKQAEKLKLSGWVRNNPDGSVETIFTGGEAAVLAMLDWLQQGSPNSRVDRIVPITPPSTSSSRDSYPAENPAFEILY